MYLSRNEYNTCNYNMSSITATATKKLSLSLSLSLSQANDKVSVGRSEAEKLLVTTEDFEHGLQYDVKPAFGISEEQLDRYVFNGQGILHILY